MTPTSKINANGVEIGIIGNITVSALSKGGFSMHTNPVIMIARC